MPPGPQHTERARQLGRIKADIEKSKHLDSAAAARLLDRMIGEVLPLDHSREDVQDVAADLLLAVSERASASEQDAARLLFELLRDMPIPQKQDLLLDLTRKVSMLLTSPAIRKRLAFETMRALHGLLPAEHQISIEKSFAVFVNATLRPGPDGTVARLEFTASLPAICFDAAMLMSDPRLKASLLLDLLSACVQDPDLPLQMINVVAQECLKLAPGECGTPAVRMMNLEIRLLESFPEAHTPEVAAPLLESALKLCDRAGLDSHISDVAARLRLFADMMLPDDCVAHYESIIRYDVLGRATALAGLLNVLGDVPANQLQPASRHTVAILSFQVDPHGGDALQLDEGPRIPYPAWLVDLRERLQHAELPRAQRDEQRTVALERGHVRISAELTGPMARFLRDGPMARQLADEIQGFEGPPATPDQWALLHELLEGQPLP